MKKILYRNNKNENSQEMAGTLEKIKTLLRSLYFIIITFNGKVYENTVINKL